MRPFRFQVSIFLWGLLVFSYSVGFAANTEGIVVWRLEKKQGGSDEEIDSISGFIASEVERLSGRKVTSESDIQALLQGEQKKQQCGVESSSCLAEIGAALGVPEVVAGDLGRVGRFWFLNLKRINVRKAEVIRRASRKVEGDINELIGVLPDAVAELFGKKTSSPSSSLKTEMNGFSQENTPTATTAYPMNPYKKYGYVSFFTGLGLCAFGGIAAWQASEKGKDYEAGDTSAKSASLGWEGAMTGAFVAGGAAMVTGIVLWALSPGDEVWAKRQNLSMAPATDGKRFGMMLHLTW